MPTIINPTLPNILTNGTTADATQVMADFAFIISQVNTNAAENGTNSSITSLSGLTTPLSTPQGGTGVASPGAHGILVGNGSGPLNVIANGAAGLILATNGTSADPSFQTVASLITSSVVTTALGFTPVQQGTGVGQLTNVVKIGWSAASYPKITIDSSDQGYIIMAPTISSGNFNIALGLNAPGLFDNGNRVWSPGNYQPFTDNGIGWDTYYAPIGTEGTTTTIGGRPGTWTWLSSAGGAGGLSGNGIVRRTA
jgi:hypothetical protein